ncbi:radical SAM/SPASM domain-containing protein [Geoglobus acetivorans]
MQHLRLAERVLLRKFDSNYYAYNAKSDTLYELDDEAFYFLLNCDGSRREADEEILNFLISEEILEVSSESKENTYVEQSEPSLRHFLISVTHSCNLKCQHCYIHQKISHVNEDTFRKAIDEFYGIGGLKLLISGGEPLLHPKIFTLLEYARKYPFRIVLMTNGYLLKDNRMDKITELVDEVQISLDGFEGHRKLRNAGWERLIDVIKSLSGSVDVSIATMVTKYNINEFEKMSRVLESLNVYRWSIDVPVTEKDLLPPPDSIKEVLQNYGFGKRSYPSIQGYACGTHYCEMDPDGNIVKCGFFEEPCGNIRNGLKNCWENLKKRYIWRLDELKCSCQYVGECRGGCRYRALMYSGDILGCDPVMCNIYDVKQICQ